LESDAAIIPENSAVMLSEAKHLGFFYVTIGAEVIRDSSLRPE
jgi:hypothetical protein